MIIQQIGPSGRRLVGGAVVDPYPYQPSNVVSMRDPFENQVWLAVAPLFNSRFGADSAGMRLRFTKLLAALDVQRGRVIAELERQGVQRPEPHLTKTQLEAAAAELANIKGGERTDLGPNGPRSISKTEAAQKLGVSVKQVKRAPAKRKAAPKPKARRTVSPETRAKISASVKRTMAAKKAALGQPVPDAAHAAGPIAL